MASRDFALSLDLAFSSSILSGPPLRFSIRVLKLLVCL
ncbi:hypothetical protein JMJ77_0014040, partial [Colletotrichum scovillei]